MILYARFKLEGYQGTMQLQLLYLFNKNLAVAEPQFYCFPVFSGCGQQLLVHMSSWRGIYGRTIEIKFLLQQDF